VDSGVILFPARGSRFAGQMTWYERTALCRRCSSLLVTPGWTVL